MTILKSYWSALMSNAGGTEQAMHQDFTVGYCHVCEDDKLGGLIVCQFTVRRK
jgi:hypothetical protein